jgi:hypothetical protein
MKNELPEQGMSTKVGNFIKGKNESSLGKGGVLSELLEKLPGLRFLSTFLQGIAQSWWCAESSILVGCACSVLIDYALVLILSLFWSFLLFLFYTL